jgi:hypothetical protein
VQKAPCLRIGAVSGRRCEGHHRPERTIQDCTAAWMPTKWLSDERDSSIYSPRTACFNAHKKRPGVVFNLCGLPCLAGLPGTSCKQTSLCLLASHETRKLSLCATAAVHSTDYAALPPARAERLLWLRGFRPTGLAGQPIPGNLVRSRRLSIDAIPF